MVKMNHHATILTMSDALDTKKLRMFVATVRAGSMRKASATLFVTPSALSHGIRSLEEMLGIQLFERNGPVLKPTVEGLQFYEEAQDVLSRLEMLGTRFTGGTTHPELHIGTTNTGCLYLFPGIVREFRESYPDVALRLEINDTDYLIERMREGMLDIVIAPVQRDYQSFEQVLIGQDELMFIVHPAHPWAQNGQIIEGTLSEQKLIMPAVNSHTYRLVDSYYRERRIPLEAFIELNNEEAIKQLVALNIGTGIVPSWIAQKELERGSLVSFPFEGRAILRRWMILHRSKVAENFPDFLFVGMTKAVAANVIQAVD